jgi:hypothetical protein
MCDNPVENLFLASIRIDAYESVFHDIQLFTLIIPTYDRLEKSLIHLFPLVSEDIRGTSKCSVDIDIHIEYDIWQYTADSLFVHREDGIDPESLRLTLIGT